MILSDAQGGFRKGRSTIDHIFVVAETVRSRLLSRTYACFLDIKSAYDHVFRDGLWFKLYQLGMRGKLWRVLMALYCNVQSCVMIGKVHSEFFRLKVGSVKAVFSPLFSLLYLLMI